MVHTCSALSDLDEFIGTEFSDEQGFAFHYGPLPLAMKSGEELILTNSSTLTPYLLGKLGHILGNLYIAETAEEIHPKEGFRLNLQ
jgi:midasin (ATPase involved in ribosome maturation)